MVMAMVMAMVMVFRVFLFEPGRVVVATAYLGCVAVSS